ncbi:hypothetical protein [uncultured Adlercreutzia sp.]|uniref:hypothetical protein n=1 Tax=uncultured Adlercreutzia sp. TaxID=875803 RepID=UPI0026F3A85D|nr:hypothetical protein [uncultured Adlercreutzia sp.]
MRKTIVAVCLALAVLVALPMGMTAEAADPATTEYAGVPVYKEYGRDTLTFVNTVLTPRKGLFGMKTKVQPRTKTLVKQSVQMCARAANADHKIVKTGTWQWNTTVDRYEYGSASITYQDTVKMCSYGQARLKSGSALTGTFTVPASPARSY